MLTDCCPAVIIPKQHTCAPSGAYEEVPVGAVIVRDGKIIARSHNQVETLKDATAHAEILAITQPPARSAIGDWKAAPSS